MPAIVDETFEPAAIGARVRSVREALGLDVETAAGMVGCGKQALRDLEAGRNGHVSLDRLWRLAVAWGCDPAALDDRLAPKARLKKLGKI
jgi:transcriptional regulator with XRE-family HTH domain